MLLEKAQRAFDSNRDPVWDSWKEQAEGWISVGEYVGAAEKAEFLNTPSLPVPSYSDADCIRWSAKLSDHQTVLRRVLVHIPVSS